MRLPFFGKKSPSTIGAFAYDGADPAGDIRDKYGFGGDLLDIFAQNAGPVVHKWHHYIPLYDRYFARFRDRPLRFLEIGVSKGGSLQMWRRYFGAEAVIFGIDIDPACAAFDGQAGQVRIGSQADAAFLRRVLDEMGGVDVVLDDGSHVMEHIRASFEVLFPALAKGGLYMIEDLHTAYWPDYGGGPGRRANLFSELPGWIADMHAPYHSGGSAPVMGISGLHVHDSVLVIEKEPVYPPVHSAIGSDA
ncbi:class I SAM-dependent methyltransferase [Oceaniglobus roseus]|uniref:class I SAM-dependent methyltransferase n=1 Tax=Oceaniglobus roseus TaxID=1737570 RepID=UPI000C7F0B8F|nr:class I SAM-dependent methyltransferase [Kandeliimicrobium roseum]